MIRMTVNDNYTMKKFIHSKTEMSFAVSFSVSENQFNSH